MWDVCRGHSLKGCRNHWQNLPVQGAENRNGEIPLPEELGELHIWRCQTGKSNKLWPPEAFSHTRSVSITELSKMDKTSNQLPPTQQVPALHVLFLFIPRERSGSGKLKKNLNLKLFECIKQNFFLVAASTHQSFLVSPTPQHSSQTPNSRYSMIHQTKVTSLQLAENPWHFPISYGKGCSKFQLFNPHLFNQRWLLKASLT